MKTKEVEINSLEQPVTIWKMNNGFRNDWIDKIGELKESVDDKGRVKQEVVYNNKKMRLYALVYGILEASELNINKPNDILLGLTKAEELSRLRVIRGLDPRIADKIYKEITDFNKVDVEEVEEIKKN